MYSRVSSLRNKLSFFRACLTYQYIFSSFLHKKLYTTVTNQEIWCNVIFYGLTRMMFYNATGLKMQ